MIKNKVKLRRTHIINGEQRKEAVLYLRGLVYAWCKQHAKLSEKEQWFATRDLLGGENYHWQKTPMIPLFKHFEGKSRNPVNDAGKAAGLLLLEVLYDDDKREFETRIGYTREYRWTGKEVN